ncbi:hypothetical protein CLV28_0699 [Sediminihabitans luteus]|uniref:Uncharacterized protein n=1 Tax=Sediminihabitans luteus TaxID=1138585 RepID=A0A2M9CZY6_9CELL|nr:hypothetical protein [Sediminihabitans luteus]PJJ77480.1 hypothetical protein CLV28_0699 [Sediminihabitans luteus]
MDLHELRETISNSRYEDDWHHVVTGPFYTDAPDVDEDTVEQHDELLVYTPNVDITIQHGLRARGFDHIKTADQLWQDASFPDPKATVDFVDVFWRGVLVDRECVVNVDGGRATIPLGTQKPLNYSSSGPRPEKYEFEYTATKWQVALARIADRDHDWASYMEQAGIIIK